MLCMTCITNKDCQTDPFDGLQCVQRPGTNETWCDCSGGSKGDACAPNMVCGTPTPWQCSNGAYCDGWSNTKGGDKAESASDCQNICKKLDDCYAWNWAPQNDTVTSDPSCQLWTKGSTDIPDAPGLQNCAIESGLVDSSYLGKKSTVFDPQLNPKLPFEICTLSKG